jgi:hypothetical protein
LGILVMTSTSSAPSSIRASGQAFMPAPYIVPFRTETIIAGNVSSGRSSRPRVRSNARKPGNIFSTASTKAGVPRTKRIDVFMVCITRASKPVPALFRNGVPLIAPISTRRVLPPGPGFAGDARSSGRPRLRATSLPVPIGQDAERDSEPRMPRATSPTVPVAAERGHHGGFSAAAARGQLDACPAARSGAIPIIAQRAAGPRRGAGRLPRPAPG